MIDNDMSVNVFESLDEEHRDCLLLCWKIREGLRKEVQVTRIKTYLDWYWENYLKRVFELEEKHLFAILNKDDKLRKKVVSQHKKIKKLFEEKNPANYLKSILLIEEELELHIRFAEKEVQNRILEIATKEQIQEIEENVKPFEEIDWTDNFWE